MNTYLAIITTVLVITQIVRVTQNQIQLHKQNILFKKQLGSLNDVTQEDLDNQRKAYRLIVERLEADQGYTKEIDVNDFEDMEAKPDE